MNNENDNININNLDSLLSGITNYGTNTLGALTEIIKNNLLNLEKMQEGSEDNNINNNGGDESENESENEFENTKNNNLIEVLSSYFMDNNGNNICEVLQSINNNIKKTNENHEKLNTILLDLKNEITINNNNNNYKLTKFKIN